MLVEVTPRGTRGTSWPSGVVMRGAMGLVSSVYRALGGRGMGNTLILTTVGARTGKKRDVHVTFFPEKGSWLVVGSKGGAKNHPAWFLNIAAHPDEVWVHLRDRRAHVKPESLRGAARAAAWKRITSEVPVFAGYETKTDREIPVVRLTPID